MLQKATEDMIGLVEAVATRTHDLIHSYQRLKGMPLNPPSSMEPDFKHFNAVFERFQAGDFRSSRDELLATRSIAQWTLDINAEIRNQDPQKVTWRD